MEADSHLLTTIYTQTAMFSLSLYGSSLILW